MSPSFKPSPDIAKLLPCLISTDAAFRLILTRQIISAHSPTQIQPMKTKQILAILTVLSVCLSLQSAVRRILLPRSGNWTSTNADRHGRRNCAGTNDDADIEAPFNVTVDSTASVQFIYGGGTVTMAPGSTLNVVAIRRVQRDLSAYKSGHQRGRQFRYLFRQPFWPSIRITTISCLVILSRQTR